MARLVAFLYGIVSYFLFFGTFLYAIGFVGNLVVPKSIDSGEPGTLASALLINTLLLGLFAVQHSVMARPGFKRWWTGIIPPAVERSTYVLLTSIILLLLFRQWQPMTDPVWEVTGAAAQVLQGLFWLGWGIVLISTFLINHFDLFGLRQVYLYFQGREYSPLPFSTRFLYQWVRHPIMLGFVVAFWATPRMTMGHLFFAVATTGYILIALRLEERDLEGFHGDSYREYQQRVSMLFPFPRSR